MDAGPDVAQSTPCPWAEIDAGAGLRPLEGGLLLLCEYGSGAGGTWFVPRKLLVFVPKVVPLDHVDCRVLGPVVLAGC